MYISFLLIGVASIAQNTGSVKGFVHDKYTGEQLIATHVFILEYGNRYQVLTDINGAFRIDNIPAGTYTLYLKYLRDTTSVKFVNVYSDSVTDVGVVDFNFQRISLVACDFGNLFKTVNYSLSNIAVVVTSEDIKHSPAKFDLKEVIANSSSEIRILDGELSSRGSRNDMLHMIDGVKVIGESRLPSSSIGKMMIYTGGLPAKYGDTLGGAVIIDTKGYFDLYRK